MTKKEKEMTKNKELDKVMEGMDILNPENDEVYRVDSDTVNLSNVNYKLIENYRDAFDLEQMKNRYSDYLLKYDYIVGDIAYQKLRLRGFFDNHRKGVPMDMKIAYLEDYLIEYCNFGSPYFVFERVDKKKEDPESYFNKKKKTRRKKNKKVSSKQKKVPSKNKRKKKRSKKFQMNQKANKKKENKKYSPKKEKSKSKKSFKIRKKKD